MAFHSFSPKTIVYVKKFRAKVFRTWSFEMLKLKFLRPQSLGFKTPKSWISKLKNFFAEFSLSIIDGERGNIGLAKKFVQVLQEKPMRQKKLNKCIKYYSLQ